jgi:amino acid adenylation domain-containing protein/non-ribosomal peptide synthase protein (TIGR01720 family)
MADLQSRIAALPPEKRALLEKRLADMAAARGPAPDDKIGPRDRAKPTPLAVQQEREWAISRFRQANNIPGAFRVEGALDLTLLSQVLTEVTERHEVLRSTVQVQPDGSRVQVVHPVMPVPTPVDDLSDLPAAEQHTEIMRRWREEVVKPFDPAQHQRLRASLMRLSQDTHVALITTDHAAADLVSVALLVQEFAALYAMRLGNAGSLPPLPIQYGDFAAWQRQFGKDKHTTELEHWKRVLDGITGRLVLPADRPYPTRPTFAGDVYYQHLDPGFGVKLRRFAEAERVSLGVVLLAALAVMLNRYLGQDDLVIGEIVSGRNRPEIERLIGCFVTALPLRIKVRDEQTLREVVRTARDTVVTAYDHQDLPLDRLIGELGLGYEASQTSLSDMWLDVRTPESTLEIPGLRISAEPVEINRTAAPLTLDLNPGAGQMELQWIYMTEMFDAETIVLLAEQFRRTLRQFIASPDLTVGRVELAVTAGPVATVMSATGNGDPSFVELFQRRAALEPHQPAVVYDGAATSFAELNRAANRLARRLRSLGAGPETPVGILVDRSVDLPMAILAVLKAGGVFVPLDPAYPAERLAFILADAGARVLVTQQRLAAELAEASVPVPEHVVVLDGPQPPAAAELADTDLPHPPSGSTAAYVIYTSGSTGRPKGAVVEHRSLTVFAADIAARLGLGAGDRFLQFASPGFDVIIEELFPTWLAGGAVVIPAGHIISSGADLGELIGQQRITVIELPTAYWHEWVRELDRTGRMLPECLRLVIIGGERVLPERVAMWRRLGVSLMHVYGLTETTCSSTFHRLDPGSPDQAWQAANLPIGTPIPSADLRILDTRLRPVPLGGTGELYIGGVSLARGYLGRPGLTAQRFVPDPDRAGHRLYRTGDLVRQRPGGELEFISRADTQIKIRGFRVEPTEIEAVLAKYESVAEAVVTMFEPSPGDRRLAAYLAPVPGAALPGPAELRGFLERELPAYMIPAAFVALDKLPLNANGKVDREKLPVPDGAHAAASQGYAAPENPVQQQLADIVAAVVGLGQVGVHDNFFEIGGDSILAIQIVARAQDAGLRLSPYDIFANPTVAALAEVAAAGPTVDAEQGEVSGPVPVAPTQRPFTVAGHPDPAHFNHSVVLDLGAPTDPDVLRQALGQLLVHHDGLRQRILVAGERTRIRIAPSGDAPPFETHDLTGLAEAGQDQRMAELAQALQRGLNLSVGPQLRAAHVRLGAARPDRLALVVHRMVADVPSLQILLADLETMIVQLTAGERITLPPKTTSWQSWTRKLTAQATTPAVQDQRAYWAGVTAAAGTAAPDARACVADAATVTVRLRPEQTADLIKAAPAALTCSTEELLLTALARTLTACTGAAGHVIDYQRHDRVAVMEEADLTRTVGPFTRTHPLALASDPAATPDTTLRSVKEALRAVPAGGIAWGLLRQDREPVPASPATLVFDYRPSPSQPATGVFTVAESGFGADEAGTTRRGHDIEVRASVVAGELTVSWRHDPGRHEDQAVQRMADSFAAELATLLELSRTPTTQASPSDFPLARVDQSRLDALMSRF